MLHMKQQRTAQWPLMASLMLCACTCLGLPLLVTSLHRPWSAAGVRIVLGLIGLCWPHICFACNVIVIVYVIHMLQHVCG